MQITLKGFEVLIYITRNLFLRFRQKAPSQPRLIMSENGDSDSELDPRIQIELEKLNTTTDEINKLELEYDVSENHCFSCKLFLLSHFRKQIQHFVCYSMSQPEGWSCWQKSWAVALKKPGPTMTCLKLLRNNRKNVRRQLYTIKKRAVIYTT